jgi:cytochrome c-type biogenesis protein CcmH/NrfG
MKNEVLPLEVTKTGWKAVQVYTMASVCLAVGLGTGYLIRGSQSPASKGPVNEAAAVSAPHATEATAGPAPNMDQMKHMAVKSAEPLLAKLKDDPNNADLLNQVGNVYRATHQFKEAATYYDKALQVDPKNPAIRTDLASCLYYTGDVDGAIAQLEKSLTYDPKFSGALFNLGIMKLKGKNDRAGAIAAWERLAKVTADPQQKQKIKAMIDQLKSKTSQSKG